MIRLALPHVFHDFQRSTIEQLVSPNRVLPRWELMAHHLTWSLVHAGVHQRHRLSIEGQEHLPNNGPVVFVANHNSHLDTLLLGAALPPSMRARFSPLAAGDTFFRSVIQSWLSSRFLNLRPLWRKQCHLHGLTELRQCLNDKEQCFLIFPEGTRSRTGAMARFKPGIGMLVAGTRIPVIPCHIQGTFKAWPSHRRLPKKGELHLKFGKARTFESHGNCSAHWRIIARDLEVAIAALGHSPSLLKG